MKSAKDFKTKLFIEIVRDWEIFARWRWENFSRFLFVAETVLTKLVKKRAAVDAEKLGGLQPVAIG